MSEQNTKISAGEIVVLTTGCYSDYGIRGYIVACVDFDIAEAAQEFLKNREHTSYVEYEFIAWLVIQEKAAPVKHREIHLGDYGDLEPAQYS